ncbi:MAG: type III-B CRISPR module RAMP protein Cmr4 [Deltaproteobacteria bacterium]|nr:type III-B CRISPR module RAMP protein Cmr4 [Deltaproteobacteria bacterium]
MFQEYRALFLYCVSPVHMGAGTALGVIDNPIQRERHTGHPVVAGSGLKGAIRHQLRQLCNDSIMLQILFGPEPNNSTEHAGALSFSDAQLVAFPVRSVRRAFVYATSPTALARLYRLLHSAGVQVKWKMEPLQEGCCKVVNPELLLGEKIALESFEFKAKIDKELRIISEWLSDNTMPKDGGYAFFRDKLKDDLVLLSDEDFNYFVKNATVVEPHVRIDDITGTAQEGGLFYTENLPPESLLVSLAMATKNRRKNGEKLGAKTVMNTLVKGKADESLPGIDGLLLQIGGDATTGRGQVVIKIVGGNDHAES